MDKKSRITDPKPPEFLRSSSAVPSKQLVSPEGFWMNKNPRVMFVDGRAYISYENRVYIYPDGCEKWERVYNKRRLRVLPIKWFYETD